MKTVSSVQMPCRSLPPLPPTSSNKIVHSYSSPDVISPAPCLPPPLSPRITPSLSSTSLPPHDTDRDTTISRVRQNQLFKPNTMVYRPLLRQNVSLHSLFLGCILILKHARYYTKCKFSTLIAVVKKEMCVDPGLCSGGRNDGCLRQTIHWPAPTRHTLHSPSQENEDFRIASSLHIIVTFQFFCFIVLCFVVI